MCFCVAAERIFRVERERGGLSISAYKRELAGRQCAAGWHMQCDVLRKSAARSAFLFALFSRRQQLHTKCWLIIYNLVLLCSHSPACRRRAYTYNLHTQLWERGSGWQKAHSLTLTLINLEMCTSNSANISRTHILTRARF